MTDSNTQLVFLDFDTFTDEGEIEYSPEQRSEILENIATDYKLFDFNFTLTKPMEGDFSTLFFNKGPIGGLADKIDFRNLDKNDTASININGLVAPPEVSIVGLSSFIGSHELGHLQGLRHGDSFAPIGSGLPSTGRPSNFSYSPQYPGPANADETTRRIMASPASVGQQLPEANESAFLSERSAVKLAFNEHGTVVSEEEHNNSISTAQAIEFIPLDVPNPLLSGDNAGKDFLVEALTVTGSLDTLGDEDFFSFEGKAGDTFEFEVLSTVLGSGALGSKAITDPFGSKENASPEDVITKPFGSNNSSSNILSLSDSESLQIADPIDPQISIFDSNGHLVPYFSDVASNNNEFESPDSILIDLELPEDDTYFIKVNDFSNNDIGEYELFGYKFQAVVPPEPESPELISGTPGDDLFIAGDPNSEFDGKNDMLFTGAGNDIVDTQFISDAGANRINTGSGNDAIFVSHGDYVFAGTGNDILDATDARGNNRISGGADDDIFFLGKNDRALGGEGNDQFYVQSGGNNLIAGNEGNDQFWIVSGELPKTANKITDFEVGEDVIGILGSESLGISPDTLELNQVGNNTEIAFGDQTLAILSNQKAGVLDTNDNSQFIFA